MYFPTDKQVDNHANNTGKCHNVPSLVCSNIARCGLGNHFGVYDKESNIDRRSEAKRSIEPVDGAEEEVNCELQTEERSFKVIHEPLICISINVIVKVV
jgi:hypothetical protein